MGPSRLAIVVVIVLAVPRVVFLYGIGYISAVVGGVCNDDSRWYLAKGSSMIPQSIVRTECLVLKSYDTAELRHGITCHTVLGDPKAFNLPYV